MNLKTAYFRLCPTCGDHGNIILPNGEKTDFICSKEFGKMRATSLLHENKIDKHEYTHIVHSIENSRLPWSEQSVDRQLRANLTFNAQSVHTEKQTKKDSYIM